jgi:hypothetical protein
LSYDKDPEDRRSWIPTLAPRTRKDGAPGSGYPGSVFAITPQGTTIFSEELNCAAVGCEPLSLIEATNGNFYGLNFSGGTVPTGDNANGTVFKVATKLK